LPPILELFFLFFLEVDKKEILLISLEMHSYPFSSSDNMSMTI
jgi:hypothetical protein